MLDFLIDIFTRNGYTAVFIMLLVCGFGVPVPEDLTLIAGGVISGLDYANVHVMHVVGLLGVLSGDSAMFLLGRYLGQKVMRRRWFARLLTPRRYARVQQKFDRYGNRLMFIARFLPGLRAPIYLTAGMTRRVPFHHFLLLDGAAALISVPVWVYLGFYGAQNHEWLLLWIRRSKMGLTIALAVAVVVALVFLWRRRRHKQALLASLRKRRRQGMHGRAAGPRKP